MKQLITGVLLVAALILSGAVTAQTGQADDRSQQGPGQGDARPSDPEDAPISRLLAAPVYLWEGLTYPVKKFTIFVERVDLIERGLDFFLNDERTGGVLPRFSIGGAIDTGIGFTAFEENLFDQGKQGRLSYGFAVRGNAIAEASYIDPALFGSRFRFETELEWLDADEGRFWPGGNNANENDRTQFALSQFSGTVGLSRPFFGDLSASFFTRYFAGSGEQSDRGEATIPLATPGVGPNVQAVELETGVRYDTRDNPFAPVSGWLLDTTLTYTEQVNGHEFRYSGYSFQVQRYIPVFRDNRILLLRGRVSRRNGSHGQSIPFYELNVLDVNRDLRGYERGRWRDRGAIVFNVEWRYQVWEAFSGSLFYDTGRVFTHYDELEDGDFQHAVGFGFRFATRRQFTFRAQVAYGDEGAEVLLKGDLEFERKRGPQVGGSQ
ncbi:MAG: BamA/TamA family outer membrane protein [Gammaproteobacteria bacterium]